MIGQLPHPDSAAARLQFEPVAHRYTLDGRVLPSVSTIIRPLSPGLDRIPRDVLAHAAQRGTWLHEAIALDLDGDLDEWTVPEVIAPEFAAWRQWREKAEADGWRWLAWERRVCSAALGFAGTLDLAAITPDGEPALLDHKRTAELPRSVPVQLTGYALALQDEPGAPKAEQWRRFCLHLQPGARARLVPLDVDRAVFLSALTCHHWSNV